VKRAEALEAAAKGFGITMKSVYWTLGSFDIVLTLDAPDETTLTAFGLSMAGGGNVRTQTLRAFSAEEMAGIIGRMK
jgi:uncharacterized protein with GYD domain